MLGATPGPLDGIPPAVIANHLPAQVHYELRTHLTQYEKLLTTLLPFPRGEDDTEIEKIRYTRVQEVYDWWVMAETCAFPDEAVGDQVERHYRLIEVNRGVGFQKLCSFLNVEQIVYRGTRHTFHSMRLLRYLSHVFASLLAIFGDNVCTDEKKVMYHFHYHFFSFG